MTLRRCRLHPRSPTPDDREALRTLTTLLPSTTATVQHWRTKLAGQVLRRATCLYVQKAQHRYLFSSS